MVKIYNLKMAIHFLENNPDRKIFSCGLYQDKGNEVTLDDLLILLKNKEDTWMYQYYTQNLGGDKWDKYAELDVFDVKKDMFGRYPGWDSENEFLYSGYNGIIDHLNNKVKKLENQLKSEKSTSKRLMLESTRYSGIILNTVDDLGEDCPKDIRKKLELEYSNFDDEYKSDFHILPSTKGIEHIEQQLSKWAFISYRTQDIDGWYAVWSYGD